MKLTGTPTWAVLVRGADEHADVEQGARFADFVERFAEGGGDALFEDAELNADAELSQQRLDEVGGFAGPGLLQRLGDGARAVVAVGVRSEPLDEVGGLEQGEAGVLVSAVGFQQVAGAVAEIAARGREARELGARALARFDRGLGDQGPADAQLARVGRGQELAENQSGGDGQLFLLQLLEERGERGDLRFPRAGGAHCVEGVGEPLHFTSRRRRP
jgi:hypothetical protein